MQLYGKADAGVAEKKVLARAQNALTEQVRGYGSLHSYLPPAVMPTRCKGKNGGG